VPKRALGVGDSIEVGADIRHWDHFSLRRGEQGIIEDIDPETGDILIRLRVSRPELKSWDNRLWVPAPYAKRLRLIRRLWLASRTPFTSGNGSLRRAAPPGKMSIREKKSR